MKIKDKLMGKKTHFCISQIYERFKFFFKSPQRLKYYKKYKYTVVHNRTGKMTK